MSRHILTLSVWSLLAPILSAQSFTTANYAVGDGPRGLATFDFANDGIPDLAVANTFANSLSLLRNDGSGNFVPLGTIALTAPSPVAVASGRLDGTGGTNDLVVACADPVSPGEYRVAKILQAGEATQAITYLDPGAYRPVHLACGDLDGDLLDEIAVACEGELITGNAGWAIFWSGTPPVPAVAPQWPMLRIALANLDSSAGHPFDGDLDIATLARDARAIDLWANDGDGDLSQQGTLALPTGGYATGLCACDLDGDEDMDLAALWSNPFAGASELRLFRNNGSQALTSANVNAGKFTPIGPFALGGSYATDVACGDLVQDTVRRPNGRPFENASLVDLTIVDGGSGTAVIRRSFNGTSFGGTASPAIDSGPVACVVADFDRDGGDDVAISNQGSDNVSVSRTRPPALSRRFGQACIGSAGLPGISSVGLPVSGAAAFSVRLENAGPFGAAFAMFSLPAVPGRAADLQLGISTCRLYLPDAYVSALRFTSHLGAADLTFRVPPEIPHGTDAFLQWVVLDSQGAFGPNMLSLSDGLRVQIGL